MLRKTECLHRKLNNEFHNFSQRSFGYKFCFTHSYGRVVPLLRSNVRLLRFL